MATCCMKGEKVSTPLDKDGRGPSGLYNTHTVKALPPTSWHLTMFFSHCFPPSLGEALNESVFFLLLYYTIALPRTDSG